jgi:hypothetical protein
LIACISASAKGIIKKSRTAASHAMRAPGFITVLHSYRAAMHKTELPIGSATTSSWLVPNDQ